jgi:1-acyl-sn-glycerol-3-phosphate acyltransferase
MRRLNHFWRICATGMAFAFIFFGGGLLAMVVTPMVLLMKERQRERVQLLIHAMFRFYLLCLPRLGLLSLEFEGVERLRAPGGRLVIANHPSLLDVVMLMALIPNAQCIVKNQLWEHRLLGLLMRRAGYIRNDLTPEDLLTACQESLNKGQSLIIFPEGTRSEPGQPPRFRRGFANLATLTEASIQLVVITCEPPTLIKGEPWWRIPASKPVIRLSARECLDAESYLGHPHRSLAARKLVQSLEHYYAEKLGYV